MTESYLYDESFVAAGDLSTYQFHFVKLSAADTVTVSGAGEKAIGVLQGKPDAATKEAQVRILGISKILADGTTPILIGDPLKSDGSGHAVKAGSDKDYFVGFAMDALGSGTAYIRILLTGPGYAAV